MRERSGEEREERGKEGGRAEGKSSPANLAFIFQFQYVLGLCWVAEDFSCAKEILWGSYIILFEIYFLKTVLFLKLFSTL